MEATWSWRITSLCGWSVVDCGIELNFRFTPSDGISRCLAHLVFPFCRSLIFLSWAEWRASLACAYPTCSLTIKVLRLSTLCTPRAGKKSVKVVLHRQSCTERLDADPLILCTFVKGSLNKMSVPWIRLAFHWLPRPFSCNSIAF